MQNTNQNQQTNDKFFDPYKSIRRMERLMRQLKLGEDQRTKNDYQHGIIDGIGNAIAILHDEIKAQAPREKPRAQSQETKTTKTIPWECWWSQDTEQSA